MMPHYSKLLMLITTLFIAPGAMADDREAAALHLYTSARQISVPFNADALPAPEDDRPHAAAVLYVSGNRGQSWVRAQKRALPTSALEFRAANDGHYWCIDRKSVV